MGPLGLVYVIDPKAGAHSGIARFADDGKLSLNYETANGGGGRLLQGNRTRMC